MLKKLISLLATVMLLSVVSISTFAEDNETAINETETDINATITENEVEVENDDEVKVLSDKTGAEIRLLQLEKAVFDQIESATTIVADLKAKNVEVDFVKLNQTISGFKAISVDISQFDFNSSADEIAVEFVALRDESRILSSEFRNEVKDIRDDIKDSLKTELKIKKEERKKFRDDRIEKLKVEYKTRNVVEFMNKYDVDIIAIAEQYKAGNITIEDIKNLAMKQYNKLSTEKKSEVKAKISEEKTRLKINVQEKREELKVKSEDIREENKQRFEKRKEAAENKFEANKDRLENLREENKQRFEANKDRLDNLREENKQRFKDNKERLDNLKIELNSKEDIQRFMGRPEIREFMKNNPELLNLLKTEEITVYDIKEKFEDFTFNNDEAKIKMKNDGFKYEDRNGVKIRMKNDSFKYEDQDGVKIRMKNDGFKYKDRNGVKVDMTGDDFQYETELEEEINVSN